jgi:hypothetical protein
MMFLNQLQPCDRFSTNYFAHYDAPPIQWVVYSVKFIHQISPAPISLVKQIPTATYFSFILVDVRSVALLSLSRSATYLFIPPLPQRDAQCISQE